MITRLQRSEQEGYDFSSIPKCMYLSVYVFICSITEPKLLKRFQVMRYRYIELNYADYLGTYIIYLYSLKNKNLSFQHTFKRSLKIYHIEHDAASVM